MSGDGIGDSLWQACVDQLAQELSEQQFNTWIKPLTAQVADDLSRITVFVANRFKLDWIRAQYAGKIAAMAEKMYGQPVSVELALAPRASPVRASPVAVMTETDVPREVTGPGEEPAPGGFKNRLNSGLTFEPNRLYATIEAKRGVGGVYRSEDAGESWQQVNNDGRIGGRGPGAMGIAVTTTTLEAAKGVVESVALLQHAREIEAQVIKIGPPPAPLASRPRTAPSGPLRPSGSASPSGAAVVADPCR